MSYDFKVVSPCGDSIAFEANKGNISDLMQAAFLSREDYDELTGKTGRECAPVFFHALCRLVGSERLLFPSPLNELPPEADYDWLRLCQILFGMWHACKEHPHYLVEIYY